jgi:hypothetical protein
MAAVEGDITVAAVEGRVEGVGAELGAGGAVGLRCCCSEEMLS